MRRKITTAIEENALKILDIKIIQSDSFKNRSTYLEFLIQFIPFIPDNVSSDTNIMEVIQKMYVNTGAESNVLKPIQKGKVDNTLGLDEADREIIKMAKNFRLKTTTKEIQTHENIN